MDERARVAELDLLAGRRAKTSTAYASALSYLGAGRALLSEESWDNKYELTFAIEYLIAGCKLLTAQTVVAESRLTRLARRARTQHDVAVVAGLRLRVYTALDRSDRAVEVFLEFLRSRGTDWSPHPDIDEVRREYDRIWSQIGSRRIEDLIDLPLMTDLDVLGLLDVLVEVMTPALFSDENLSSLVICRMVNLSLELVATWTVALIQAHRTFRQKRNAEAAKAAFLAVIDQGTIGLKAAMAGTPYA